MITLGGFLFLAGRVTYYWCLVSVNSPTCNILVFVINDQVRRSPLGPPSLEASRPRDGMDAARARDGALSVSHPLVARSDDFPDSGPVWGYGSGAGSGLASAGRHSHTGLSGQATASAAGRWSPAGPIGRALSDSFQEVESDSPLTIHELSSNRNTAEVGHKKH